LRALLAGVAGTMLLALLTQPESSLDKQIRDSIDAMLAMYVAASPRARKTRTTMRTT
jgi:hypothetical protein